MQAGILRMIADDAIEGFNSETIDQSSNASPEHCAGTHRAGFGAGIKGAARNFIYAQFFRCFAHQVRFGMSRAIAFGHHRIFGFEQNATIRSDKNCPKWMVPILPGPSRYVYGKAKEFIFRNSQNNDYKPGGMLKIDPSSNLWKKRLPGVLSAKVKIQPGLSPNRYSQR